MNTVNKIYRDVLANTIDTGDIVSPRGQKTRELRNHIITVPMMNPVITIPERKLNYRFMAAEAYWMLIGSSQLSDLTPYCKRMAEFTDDNVTLSGAYGPRFLQQVKYVTEKLIGDTVTRQAVMTFWERNPRDSRDIPCTVSAQFQIREGKLHATFSMRSQDVWLGIPYDIFSFSMMTTYVGLSLSLAMPWLVLGDLTIFAGSRHIYESNVEAARDVASTVSNGDNLDIGLYWYNTPVLLKNDLGNARNVPNVTTSSKYPLTSYFAKLCP